MRIKKSLAIICVNCIMLPVGVEVNDSSKYYFTKFVNLIT